MTNYNDPNWKAKRSDEMMKRIKKERDASEADAHAKNKAEEARNPEYKATMDKVRAAMNAPELSHMQKAVAHLNKKD